LIADTEEDQMLEAQPITLTETLRQLELQIRAKRDPAATAVSDRSVCDLAESGLLERALKVGGKAPAFTLKNVHGREVSLRSLLDRGPAVVSFYRGGWCPYCSAGLRALQAALPEITAAGASLVAISPELPEHSRTTAEKNALTFEVLSDAGNAVARAFGLGYVWPEDFAAISRSHGVDVAGRNGMETVQTPVPATYAIGRDGYIVYAFIDADYTKRAEPSEIIAALRALAAR
jgi:peroxiredoxin